MTYQIRVARSFLRASKRLARKYRRLKQDLLPIQRILANDPYRGVAIPGFAHRVWKIRMASRDMQSGKRGGYRVIYAIDEQEMICYLLFIYIKTERSDITPAEIENLLQSLEDDL